jgi:hypothetical protein
MRQIQRVDHLCPEILEQVIGHPYIHPHKSNIFRKSLQFLKLIDADDDAHMVHPHADNQFKFPPFFIAMPRGRISKEEMTIQQMYN